MVLNEPQPFANPSASAVEHVQIQRFARARPVPWCGPAPRSISRGRQRLHECLRRQTAGTAAPSARRPSRPGHSGNPPFRAPFRSRSPSAPPRARRPARPRTRNRLIGAPDQFGELVHRLLHNVGTGGVERVARLARLEEHVGILRGAAQHRPVGGHRPDPVRG